MITSIRKIFSLAFFVAMSVLTFGAVTNLDLNDVAQKFVCEANTIKVKDADLVTYPDVDYDRTWTLNGVVYTELKSYECEFVAAHGDGDVYVTLTYTHKVTGQQIFKSARITVLNTPDFTITGATSLCKGEGAVRLGVTSAQSGLTYQLKNGTKVLATLNMQGTFNYDLNPDATTDYTVEAFYQQGGCGVTKNHTVVVNEFPVADLKILGSTSVCTGGETVLSTSIAPADLSNYTFEWNGDGISGANDQPTVLVKPTSNSKITLELTYRPTGCKSKNSVYISIDPMPDVEIGSNVVDDKLCEGDSATLRVNPVEATTGYTYLWSTNETTPTIKVGATNSGTQRYTVKVKRNGCEKEFAIDLHVMPRPTMSGVGISGANVGCTNSDIELTANFKDATNFVWYRNNDLVATTVVSKFVDRVTQAGAYRYYVEASNANGCKISSKEHSVVVSASPEVEIISSSNFEICNDGNSTIDLKAEIKNGLSAANMKYQWYRNGTPIVGAQARTYTVKSEDLASARGGLKYSVEVEDITSAGCKILSEEKSVKVYDKPTFTYKVNGSNLTDICVGEEAVIEVSSTLPGTVNWVANATTMGGNKAKIEPTAEGLLMVKMEFTTLDGGCTYESTFGVNAKNPATPEIVGETERCAESTQPTVLRLKTSLVGAQSYSWESSEDGVNYTLCGYGNQISVSPSVDTKYRIKAQYNLGCERVSNPISVTINSTPVIALEANGVVATTHFGICESEPLVLKASAGAGSYEYVWSIGGVAQPANLTGELTIAHPTTGAYVVRVKNTITGCEAEKQITVKVNPLPDVTFESSNIDGFKLCKGGSLTITSVQNSGTGVYTYSWSNGSTLTPMTIKPAATIAAGDLWVDVTNESGCVKRFFLPEIEVVDQPQAVITPMAPLCSGTEATLVATPAGAAQYRWYKNGILWRTVNGDNSVSYQGDAASFEVVVKNASGCESRSAAMQLLVNSTPVVKIEGDNELCPAGSLAGATTTLMAKVAGNSATCTYQWYRNDVELAGANDAEYIASDAATYKVKVIDGTCSAVSSDFVVKSKVIPAIQISILGETSNRVCIGGDYTLQLQPTDGVFNWTNTPNKVSSTANTLTIRPTASGTLSYTVEMLYNGCRQTKTYTVEVNDVAKPTIAGPDKVCQSSPFQLTASEGYTNYIWYAREGAGVWNSCGATRVLNVENISANREYKVQCQDITYGCTIESESHLVSLLARPTITIASDKSDVCEGSIDDVNITATAGYPTYKWYANNTPIAGTTNTINVVPTATTTYKVEIVDNNGCEATSNFLTITKNVAPQFAVPANVAVCWGDDVKLVATGETGLTYSWDGGAAISSEYEINNISSSRLVNVTSTKNGCSTTKSCQITVAPQLTPSIAASEIEVCVGEVVDLSSTGYDTYKWYQGATYLGEGEAISVVASDYIVGAATTVVFRLEVSKGGCNATVEQVIRVKARPEISLVGVPTGAQCRGTQVVITASGADEYSWNGGAFSPTNIYTATIDVAKSITVEGKSNSSHCSSELRTINLDMLPEEAPIAVTRKIENCEVVLSAEVGVTNYQWYKNGVAITGATTREYRTVEAGIYKVSGMRTCEVESAPVDVEAISAPSVGIMTNDGSFEICNGGSKQLIAVVTGVNEYKYRWVGGGTTLTDQDSWSVSPTTDTRYTLYVTDKTTGCEYSTEVEVTVNNLPTPTISGPTAICNGGVVSIVAPEGAVGYLWNNNKTTRSIDITQGGTYTCELTYVDGCKVVSNPHIVVMNTPTQVTLPVTEKIIVEGESATLSVNSLPGYRYEWRDDLGAVVSSPVSPDRNTAYTVEAIDANGCSTTAQLTVRVNLKPVVYIEASTTELYLGNSVELTARVNMPGCGYVWSTGATSDKITINPAAVGSETYTVEATAPSGAKGTAYYTVVTKPKPNLFITGDLAVCAGGQTTLTAETNGAIGSIRYDWNHISGTDDGAVVVVTPSGTGETYRVKAYNAQGDAVGDEASVFVTANSAVDATINSSPTANINIETCPNEPVLLTAHPAGGSYEWSNGETSRSITVNPIQVINNYWVDVTKNGCVSHATAVVEVKQQTPTISASAANVCPGEEVVLRASEGEAWVWSDGLGSTQEVRVRPISTTTYRVAITKGGCSSEATHTINVNQLSPTINSIEGITHIAKGETTRLTVVGENIDNCNWTGNYIVSSNDNGVSVNPPTTTTYTVEAFSANGCKITREVTVEVHEVAQPKIIGVSVLCQGGSGTLSLVSPVPNAVKYLWNDGSIGAILNIRNLQRTTTYRVKAIDQYGCESAESMPFTITVNEFPDAGIVGESEACKGGTVALTAPEAPIGMSYTYLWGGLIF